MKLSSLNTELDQKFSINKTKSLFIPYFSLGDPDYESSIHWAEALAQGGADIIELGIPFSDPVADGPVIQRAFTRAFKNPFSLEQIFNVTRQIKANNPSIPLVYLTYFNPIYHSGTENFLLNARKSGVCGLIIPDLPFDSPEGEDLFARASKLEVNLIHLITPATEKKRIEKLKPYSSGYLYYVSSFGVTGERTNFPLDMKERITWLKNETGIPVACGFGISTPEQSEMISKYSDGIIIGSSIQRIIEENGSNKEKCKKKLTEYCTSIKQKMK